MKLYWKSSDPDVTTDERWVIQREHGLHEPPFYSIMFGPPGWRETAERAGIHVDGAFSTSGGRRRIQRLCQRIEDAIEREESA